ncbi:TetR family transcriptional regulator [Streptomyces sp. YC504]|uniref:TetR family transcriptional regulator n=1 Tax=Streptomyces mesophilus TaxID=1775132 RepID=A0A6G4XB78_9ACTN|nr:TetR/AcrR family transcriptional regulator [Streptomyces mesophilus]NGO74412.1 TetR family transcriptional regulator [Streptomyces mesophilus]
MHQKVNEARGVEPSGLRELKKQRRRERIVAAATDLVRERGIDEVTVTDIAEVAQVGRATFFRHFDSKESAVVIGFYENRLAALLAALAEQPEDIDPRRAMAEAIRTQIRGFQQSPDLREFDLLQGRMVAASPSLRSRGLEFQETYTTALAQLLAPRFGPLAPTDLRPRYLAAHALAVLRIAVEQWVAEGGTGDLPAMVESGLEWLEGGRS